MPEQWLPNPAPYPRVPPHEWPAAPPPRPEPAPEQVPPEPSGRWPAAGVLLVAGVVAILLTALLVVLLRPRSQTAASPPTTAPAGSALVPTTVAPGSITQAGLDQAVDRLIPFVEQERGLKFLARPTATVVPDATFVSDWHRVLDATLGPVAAHLQVPFEALQLSPSSVDLPTAVRAWFGDDLVEFYDPTRHVIEVRSSVADSPYLDYELVGSLTAALDDAHFVIDKPDPTQGLGDPQFAMHTLVSGDTTRIANAWGGTRSTAEQSQISRGIDEHQQTPRDPSVLPVPFAFWLSQMDVYGPNLLDALRGAGGQARIDQAFMSPPPGSAQTIDVARYLAGDAGIAVAPPPADGQVVAQGQFGLLLLRVALQAHVSSDLLSEAMKGYRGDALVAWTAGGGSCVRVRVASVDAPATAAMAQAFTGWASEVKGSSSVVADPTRPGQSLVQGEVCNGGGSGSPSTDSVPGGGGSGI